MTTLTRVSPHVSVVAVGAAVKSPTDKSVKRLTGFDPVRQDRISRAKTKPGKDARRVNGSTIRATEDAARRRFAAVRAESGSPDWTQVVAPVPVSKFILSLDGGNKGLLVNSANLCSASQQINVKMLDQNANANVTIQTPCSSSGRGKTGKSHRQNRGANPNRRAQR
jgi:hypothetical protein